MQQLQLVQDRKRGRDRSSEEHRTAEEHQIHLKCDEESSRNVEEGDEFAHAARRGQRSRENGKKVQCKRCQKYPAELFHHVAATIEPVERWRDGDEVDG